MLNRRPATRKTPPALGPFPLQTNQSEGSSDYSRQSTPSSPGFHVSTGLHAITAANIKSLTLSNSSDTIAQPATEHQRDPKCDPQTLAPSLPPRPLRSRVVSMPAVPTNFTRHDADSTLANHEDRALRRVSHNIYNDNRSTRNVGSIRTGPNVLERAALFGGATTASSKTTSRRSRYDTLAETDDTPTSLPSSRFLNSAYSSSSSSSTSSTVAANTTNTAATLYVDENLQKEIIKENPKHIDDKLNANVASYTSINNTMKGTVKKWLIRGAAVVTQGSSAATVSKRDNTVRRGPVASLLPRDHRQSINLHDIDAILDMGDDTVAEVASSSASASPLKIANVSAARAVWTAFEEEAKSKIYSSENTKRKETFIDATAISSEVYVPASWLPLSSPVKQSNLSVKNNDKQHESSANPNTNSDHASNSLTKPQTTTSPVILNLTPTAIALHENEYRMTPTKELSRPVILQPSTFLLSPKRELASTDTKELSTAMLKMPKQEKSVNELRNLSSNTIKKTNTDNNMSSLALPSQSTTQSIQSFNENTNNNSNKVIALDKNAVDSASLPIESSKIPPQRPSRLHIPVMETKPFTSKVSSTKMTLKSTSIHPSPLKDTNESPIEHNQRTLRRIDRIQPRLLNSTEDKADPVMELNTDTCSSPTDINSHSVPKPWLLDEDVQWNERDAEGLRRNSASDIQSRPIIQVNGDSNLSVKNEHRDKLEHEKHEEGADMYHTIHSGYDSDDTILRPPLMRSRSIHRPVQGGLTRKKTTRLARRGSLASTLSGSDRDTLKYTTMKPYYSPLIKDQMTATVTNSGTAASSPSLAQSWMDLEINSGPKSPLAMVMASIVLPDTVSPNSHSPFYKVQEDRLSSHSASNDSLDSNDQGFPYKAMSPKSKKDLDDLQSLQLLAMRPTEATPLTPAKGGSWFMMVNRDIFERASNMERRRQEAIYELIATEESYVADLEIVDELFYRPMKKLLSRNDFEAVFSNLDAIRVATERLMHVLRRRQWQGQFHVATIGDLFIEKMPSLECYVAYCANHMEATAKLQLLLQTDPRLNHWLKRRQSDPLCRNLDLASFLLQPMQRVTRYALLLRQICSYTPLKHADHTSIRQAVDLAEDLLRRSNEAARDRADLSRLKEIAASLIMDSQAQQLDLTGSTRHLGQRRFVMEGVWIKGRQGRRITAFLFTDLLLLCEPARAQIGMYKPYLDPIPLLELEVRETSGTRSLLRLEDSTFQIVHKKRSLNVKAENAGAKRKWLQTIRECIARCREAHRSNENGWLQAPSLRELTGKVLWAIRVMIVEVTGLTTTTGASKFDHSMLSVYCSVSLNQRQTYRTAVVNTDTTVINNNNNNSAAGVNANMNANTTSVSANSHARWEQAFLFTITDLDDALRVAVYTYDRFSCDTCLGYCEIDLRFLEFLDARGDERVALKLKTNRSNKSLAPGGSSPPNSSSSDSTPVDMLSIFKDTPNKNTNSTSIESDSKSSNSTTNHNSSTNNSLNNVADPIVVIALSYRKSA